MAGLSAILTAADTGLVPGTGFRLFLAGTTAAILGGVGSTRGIVAGVYCSESRSTSSHISAIRNGRMLARFRCSSSSCSGSLSALAAGGSESAGIERGLFLARRSLCNHLRHGGIVLNVTSGLTRLISLAHAGFFGVGAYTTALLATRFGWPFWVNLPLAMVIGGVLALPVALVARRTVEDYFIVCTMGMGYILFSLMNNCMALTSGPLGIAGIPPVALFGFQLTSKWHWTLFSFAVRGGILHVLPHQMVAAWTPSCRDFRK